MGASAYTRERLEEAARGARTLSEALERLGVDPTSWKRRYVHERMKKLGVDVSHFEREGVRWTREILEPVVAASTSVNEVLRKLGLATVGGHHTNISRRIKSYGLDTSHFTPVVRTERQRYNQRRRTAEEILVEETSAHTTRARGTRLKRALREVGVEEQCALCGVAAVWLGEPLPLEVDHIDGNWRNNRVENLRLLCPNCHSTTDRYRGRGKRLGNATSVPGQTRQRGKPGTNAARAEDVLTRNDGAHRIATKRLRRALHEIGVPEQCAGCGVGPVWLDRPMTLEVDHINADWRDNRRENLRLLCPNCHAITSTWCRGGRRAPRVAQ
jgi:Zn finger protein HypA/HybF involved in hydrogenase expression